MGIRQLLYLLEEMDRSPDRGAQPFARLRSKGRAARRLTWIAAIAGAIAASLPSLPALAATPSATTAPATLAVVADAPGSKAATSGLGGKLPAPWKVTDAGGVRKALAAAGQKTGVGLALGSEAGRASLAKKARKAAADAGVGAVLFVRVAPKHGAHAVTLLLVAPGDDSPALDTTVEVPASDDGTKLLDTLSPALAKIAPSSDSAPPSSTPEKPEATPDKPAPGSGGDAASDDSKKSASTPLGGADRSILVFSAGGGMGARVFRYHDGLSPSFRTYDLGAAPNLVLAAEVYPMARLKVPVIRGLGIAGGFQHAVAFSSKTMSGATASTTWYRVEGDLRLRLPFGEDGRFILGLHGGIVKERFGFTGDASLVAWLPDVDYLFWRVGADGRLRVGPVAILAGASYMPAIQGGALADRFRQTSFAAVEMSAGVAVPLARIFEFRAQAVYTRAFYSFHPEVGDVYVAGGALDHLIRAHILATLLL